MQDILDCSCVEYTLEEKCAALAAIQARFGEIGKILREVVAPEIRVDLCVVEPSSQRPYITLVTCGMGAREMPVPHELREHSRAELVFMLPEDWDIGGRDECGYWPLRWLKLLARLPWEEESWLGWGHTVPNGEPFAENTDYSSVLLLDAYIPEEAGKETPGSSFLIPDSCKTVRFYQCFALYDEELDFQLEYGVQALLERFAQAGALSPVLNLARENLFPPARGEPGPQKQPLLAKQELRPLLRDWQGPAGCLATDRILVEGAAVGYCYREGPAGEWDSGWRFTAGDESDEYMDDPRHSDVYTLNCVANYDADIVPILKTPAPCAFARGELGLERLKNIK